MKSIGVLVMAYGGPSRLEEVEPYLLDVRGFRPTPPAMIAAVRERYARIGGCSPILERTVAQATALGAALATSAPQFDISVGMRHWHPYIRDTLREMEARGITKAVGLVMAPHFSRMSIAEYYRAVAEAGSSIEVRGIESWHLEPGYVRAVARRVRTALARFAAEGEPGATVVFTAHSLPERILSWDDPYPRQLAETVAAVMAVLGPRPHCLAYQSASHTHEPWLGPDVADVVDALARDGARCAVIAPIGFVSEHVEILYDLDIELAEHAAARGVRIERIEMPGADPELITGLAALVRRTAREAGWM
ncbi:MAG TPA: ferrochelatase [Gemmatimonadales bacterium]|nr:ferrochelatase [Gemmatimonadales bacterium]